MRALKALVIVMGVLIVLGLAVVAVTIVRRTSAPQPGSLAERVRAAPAKSAEEPYGPVAIPLPSGARILSTATAGRRLIVTLELAGGGQRLLVLELETGTLLGTIDLKPSP